MSTPETALTSGSSGGESPATDGAAASTAIAPASTSGGETGIGQAIDAAAQTLTDQAVQQPAELDTILGGIPADDTDLAQYQSHQVYKDLVAQRGQLRALKTAVQELQPLKPFQSLGDPAVLQNRLKTNELLYSPVLDSTGKPIRDPVTQTTYVTTRPLYEHLAQNSPGMAEQLLVDGAAFMYDTGRTDAQGKPIYESGIDQLLRHYKLNPARMDEYRNIDALIARTSGAVTAEELAEIPAEYHAAYRTIPAGVRNAWASLDESEQLRTLETYKAQLSIAQRDEAEAQRVKAEEARRIAEHNAAVAVEQDKYLDTIRRERTASMIQSLAKQVQFSTDPIANKVMFGSLAATMAQLLDPVWRFVVIDEVLTPLGLSIDSTFDEALARFDSSAADHVALRMAGDKDRAQTEADKTTNAVNQLMAKLSILALKVAAKQGATALEQATRQGAALATATSGRPGFGNATSAPASEGSILPAGMKPGTREAVEYLARKTGYMPATG